MTKRPRPSRLIELFPSGISVQSEVGRPVLVLKDSTGTDVLPVWMHALDANVAIAELSDKSGLTPHAASRQLLSELGFKLESCTFTELIGHHQFVELHFVGQKGMLPPPALEHMRLRADIAMSFCLQAKTRFLASKIFMSQCRDLDADLGRLEDSMTRGILPGLQAEIEISSKKHPYVM